MIPAKIKSNEIGFDLDGVIADTAEAFIRLACHQFNYCSFSLKDITSFQIENCLSIPTPTVEQIFYAILKDSLVGENARVAGQAVRVNLGDESEVDI